MNDLNTQQIVLLCLLVSFVSSVATGIITVSLLDQAPEPVSQTINRVVERTIEKVVDPVVKTVTNSKPPERIIETVVVNQEDLTVEAVEKTSKGLARIYGLGKNGEKIFVGLGMVVSSSGKILTSSTALEMSQKLFAEYPDGSFEMKLEVPSSNGAIILAPLGVEEGKAFSFVNFGNSQNIKLGQSIIVLGGQDRNLVSTGIVTSLESKEGVIKEDDISSTEQPSSSVSMINTSVAAESIIRGAVLISLKGEIIGMRIMGASGGSFISSNLIKSSMGI